MDPQRIEELLPFYALDALTDEERGLVEEYLREHPEARPQMREMGEAAAALPYGLSPVEPSVRTKQALMARVAVDAEARSRASNAEGQQDQSTGPRAMRFVNIFQAFSMGVAVVAIVWAVALNLQLAQLRKDVAMLNTALVAQSSSLQQINAQLTQASSSAVKTMSLKGTQARPQAQGQLIADPKSDSAVLVIAGLAQLEAGRTYQVWLIQGQTPISAGLLSVDANGQAVLIVTSKESIDSFNALGISVEPDGGSPQPTGDIVVLSDL